MFDWLIDLKWTAVITCEPLLGMHSLTSWAASLISFTWTGALLSRLGTFSARPRTPGQALYAAKGSLYADLQHVTCIHHLIFTRAQCGWCYIIPTGQMILAKELGFKPEKPEGQESTTSLFKEERDFGSLDFGIGHFFTKKGPEQLKGPRTQHRSGALWLFAQCS